MKVELKGDNIVITIPANTKNPPLSKASGKTRIVATSGGNKDTGIEVQGQSLYVGVNAYIRNSDSEG